MFGESGDSKQVLYGRGKHSLPGKHPTADSDQVLYGDSDQVLLDLFFFAHLQLYGDEPVT